jgi:hypothetical protein
MALVIRVSCSSEYCAHLALSGNMRLVDTCPYSAHRIEDVLVFPAASRPSISRRISLLPKILAMVRETAAPIVNRVVWWCT